MLAFSNKTWPLPGSNIKNRNSTLGIPLVFTRVCDLHVNEAAHRHRAACVVKSERERALTGELGKQLALKKELKAVPSQPGNIKPSQCGQCKESEFFMGGIRGPSRLSSLKGINYKMYIAIQRSTQ